MHIEKRFLTSMNRCYSATHIEVDGQTRILLATEGEGPLPGLDRAGLRPRLTTVWDGPGGTMSMVPIPGTNGEFLAVQKFFKMFQWEEAKLVHVKPAADGSYQVTDVLHLPYIHRFDLLPVDERLYFIGCTLATTKESREDWSSPGKIFVGEYRGPGPLQVSVLKDGLTQNHGFSRLERDGRVTSLVTCREGAYRGHAAAAAGGSLDRPAVHGLADQRHRRHRHRR